MKRRTTLIAVGALLCGCAGPRIDDYAGQRPVLDLRRYFDGRVNAYGIVHDRFGRLTSRFTVVMDCHWDGDTGTLDERFTYADGRTERRVWTLTRQADGRYAGSAGDVVGTASGQVRGNAFQWRYTLRLPIAGQLREVQFDDWMYLMDERVMLNKAVMSKYGIRLAEVTLSFVKP